MLRTMNRDGFWLFVIVLISLYTLHLHRSNIPLDIHRDSIHGGRTPWNLDDRLKHSEEIYTEMLVRRDALLKAHPGELPM